MSEAIVVAIISGGLALLGTVVTVLATNHKQNNNLIVMQAVTDTKIDTLTEEVRKHNNFAQRMPVIEEQIKVINHRIDDLEEMTKK